MPLPPAPAYTRLHSMVRSDATSPPYIIRSAQPPKTRVNLTRRRRQPGGAPGAPRRSRCSRAAMPARSVAAAARPAQMPDGKSTGKHGTSAGAASERRGAGRQPVLPRTLLQATPVSQGAAGQERHAQNMETKEEDLYIMWKTRVKKLREVRED